jgi:hypothetical protein
MHFFRFSKLLKNNAVANTIQEDILDFQLAFPMIIVIGNRYFLFIMVSLFNIV